MKSFASVAVLAGGALAAITSEPSYIVSSFPPVSTPSPAPSAIESEAPSVKPIISTSNIKGKGFTKFYSIWFENTDYNVSCSSDRRPQMPVPDLLNSLPQSPPLPTPTSSGSPPRVSC